MDEPKMTNDRPLTRLPGWKAKLSAISGARSCSAHKKRILYLLLDTSNSMKEHDKLEMAKSGAIAFAADAVSKGYHVGAIAFASSPREVLQPSPTVLGFAAPIRQLRADGSTNLTAALQMVASRFPADAAGRCVCVVTDGMPDDQASALLAASDLRGKGVEILAIGTDDADIGFLRRLASSDRLSHKVDRSKLGDAIRDMSLLLEF